MVGNSITHVVDTISTDVWTSMICRPDLVTEREGHCSATASVRLFQQQHSGSGTSEVALVAEYAVVLGGFVDGGFEPTAVAAQLPTTLPHHSSSSSSGKMLLLEWHVCGSNAAVCEVDGMSAVADDRRQCFWLFGGMDGETYTPRNTVFRADWSVKPVCSEADDEDSEDAQRQQLQLNFSDPLEFVGDVPTPRYRHCATFCPQSSCMFVFGGVTEAEEQVNDLYCLNTASLVWTHVNAGDGGASIPRQRFLSVLLLAPLGKPTTNNTDDHHDDANGSGFSSVLLVMYGGAHFRGGQQESLSDAWAIRVTTSGGGDVIAVGERWHLVVDESRTTAAGCDNSEETMRGGDVMMLPCVNGHCGITILLPHTGGGTKDGKGSSIAHGAATEAAGGLPPITTNDIHCLFFGGKDFTRGTNNVFKLSFTVVRSIDDALSTHEGGQPISSSAFSLVAAMRVESVRVVSYRLSGHTDDDIRHGGGYDTYTSGGASPHWRYTATITRPSVVVAAAAGDEGSDAVDVGPPVDMRCLLIAGQCRHNDPTTVYQLNWRVFV